MKVKHLAIIIIVQIIIIINTFMLFNLDNDNYYTFNNLVKAIDLVVFVLFPLSILIGYILSETDWDKKL